MENLEQYFNTFRTNIIGNDAEFTSPFGVKPIVYADWIASGRLYKPIEDKLQNTLGPLVGNTHTETSETGTKMTNAYHYAQHIIKKHVNADKNDVIITAGFGMTAVINKFMRILGLKGCGAQKSKTCFRERDKPVVFITHMEHHSNHTSWYETSADVVILKPTEDLLVDLRQLELELEKYKDRKFKIGSFTACSNVTGVRTPYHNLAKLMHQHGGVCFIDFAASAPYEEINMHPADPMEKLDAVMFSPHKFLGGPGSSGVLIFDATMYNNAVPDHPGGGTVDWTNPWGEYKYVDNIEAREDGGTPGFLQAIKTALCIRLKEQMGIDKIKAREEELVKQALSALELIPEVNVLAANVRDRLGIISFYINDLHYNLLVKLLNDLYGIQVRGGCACAGTYGHFMLHVSHNKSKKITEEISSGNLSHKPGWVRWSLHPTMKNQEIKDFAEALKYIIEHKDELTSLYKYVSGKNEFIHIKNDQNSMDTVKLWFNLKV